MSKPMFFNADAQPVSIENIYLNSSVFLILSGPSLLTYDLSKLNSPNIITFGVNNSPKIFRPNLWTMVDDPSNFMISIWKDPKITKFVPITKTNHKLFDNTTWTETEIPVKSCPGMIYHYRNEQFNHQTYLTEDTINWGNHKDYGGGRSVFLSAMRIVYLLGFRKVFLLGADFKMEQGKQNYAWNQDRSISSINNNNSTYQLMNDRFDLLRPIFEKNNFQVYNCNANSGLRSFQHISFEDAIKIANSDFPDTTKERADGMYERRANDTKEIEKRDIKKKLDKKRAELDVAKAKRAEYLGTDNTVIDTLNNNVINARKVFREIEKRKNKIWKINKNQKDSSTTPKVKE
jgi:hypothetical protein